eukprot:3449529-Prorocentrum_lima.AAC.1
MPPMSPAESGHVHTVLRADQGGQQVLLHHFTKLEEFQNHLQDIFIKFKPVQQVVQTLYHP